MDNLSYTYTSNTNQLSSIIDPATNGYTTDFKAPSSSALTYDAMGRLTATVAQAISNISYTVRNKTSTVTFSNGNLSYYFYNDKNIKHKTVFYNNATAGEKFDWFLIDESGQIQAVYEYDQDASTPAFAITEEHLYAAGRLGVLQMGSGEIDYELTDHLGNVRASFKEVIVLGVAVPQVVSWTDYYAFGGAMPGRSYNLGTYRFGYQ